jgi:NAD(P)-dependent dehydrogenase (short-subunit alcohol dehydrogenase family)
MNCLSLVDWGQFLVMGRNSQSAGTFGNQLYSIGRSHYEKFAGSSCNCHWRRAGDWRRYRAATGRRRRQGAVADFDVTAAHANADRIRSAGGVAEVVVADVSRTTDIQAMVEKAVEQWNRLDILVNNAWGGKGPDGSALTVTESTWDYGMNIMVKSLFLATKYAAPYMQKVGKGSIVNISSVHGLLVAPGKLVYEAAKTAVIGVTRQMACDLGPLGIRVNAICPGHIVTERMQARWDKNPSLLELFKAQYPLRRVGRPEDIANAIRFLCSDEASFITGHTLVVDGGITIQFQEDFGIAQAQFYRDHTETALPGPVR